jgi:hypothetical protein
MNLRVAVPTPVKTVSKNTSPALNRNWVEVSLPCLSFLQAQNIPTKRSAINKNLKGILSMVATNGKEEQIFQTAKGILKDLFQNSKARPLQRPQSLKLKALNPEKQDATI